MNIGTQQPSTSNGLTRAMRKIAGATAIFYLLAWLGALVGYHGWQSSLPPCQYTSGYRACQADSRAYVPWTVYDQWRPVLNGETSTPPTGNDAADRYPATNHAPNHPANRPPRPPANRPGNPRAKIAAAMLAVYLQLQGADLVRQVDALPRTCGGFHVELGANGLLLPHAAPTPATC